RRVTEADRERYLELAEAFYDSPAVLEPVPRAYLVCTFDEMMRSDVYVDGFMLESDAGESMGYALISKSFTQEAGGLTIWVEELSVLPAFRGQGVGSEVLEWVTAYYPDWKRLRLEVERENDRAIKLYERHGFEELAYYQMTRDVES
ncbi:MAG: GNAT family N-acetyltransferase, partial [Clostridia bacterium]